MFKKISSFSRLQIARKLCSVRGMLRAWGAKRPPPGVITQVARNASAAEKPAARGARGAFQRRQTQHHSPCLVPHSTISVGECNI